MSSRKRVNACLPVEETQFLRLDYLIRKIAPEAVRHRFDQVFPPADLHAIFQKYRNKLQDLGRKRFITIPQLRLLFPRNEQIIKAPEQSKRAFARSRKISELSWIKKIQTVNIIELVTIFKNNGRSPSSSKFDIRLMMCLFRHLTKISPISALYYTLPPPSDVTVGGDLARINYYRNSKAHYLENDGKINNADFEIVWEDISEAIGRLGGQIYADKCSKLLTTNLDSSHMEEREIPFDEEERLFNRIVYLLFLPCATAARRAFNHMFPPDDLPGILKENENKIRNHCSKAHIQMLFPTTGIVSSEMFDLTLIFVLCDALADIIQREFVSIQSEFSTIKAVRNKIAHNVSCKISTDEFRLHSATLLKVIEQLGDLSLKEECISSNTFINGTVEEHAHEELKSFQRLIPGNIQTMDYASFERYINMLETGKEVRRDIRLIVVGKQGSGKSSLVARLLHEKTDDVGSTNGIEIHRQRRKVCMRTGKWIIQTDKNNVFGEEANTRLFKCFQTGQDNFTNVATSNEVEDNTKETRFVYLPETDVLNNEQDQSPLTSNPEDNLEDAYDRYPQMQCFTDEAVLQEVDTIVFSELGREDLDEYACLTIWDFAGHKEFYDTHPIFLSKDAVYLVATRLDEKIEGDETFRYWFDSIHYYGRRDNKLADQAMENINPPVVAVGTFKDKCDIPSKVIDQQIKQLLGNSVSRRHLRSRYAISNIHDTDVPGDENNVFESLRGEIFKLARELPLWEKEYPVVFIQLEKCLQSKLNDGVMILSFGELQNIAADQKPVPITNVDDVKLFLRYQHEIGNLIHFPDVSQNIFLDPQWLVNSFRCIISAKEFHYKQEISPEEYDCFLQTGEITPSLLEKFFKSQPPEIRDNRQDILNLMERFDIIVKPAMLIDGREETQENYYAPCVIKKQALANIDDIITKPTEKSSCLCFVFDFLPPAFINHLVIACMNKYPISSYNDDGELIPAIFQRMAIFDIENTRREKLVIVAFHNTIQIQIFKYGCVKFRKYLEIAESINDTIQAIQQSQYCALDLRFDMMVKCSETAYTNLVGLENLDQFGSGYEYMCKEHQSTHVFINDWLQTKDGSESDTVSGSHTGGDITTNPWNINVHCHILPDTSSDSKKRKYCFSHEENNFAKLGKITLNILADVLFDRLQIDGVRCKPREECDITYLYDIHRNKNNRIPRRIWGGKQLTDIPQLATQIGDDIERIRLIRNELQHGKTYCLPVSRYHELCVVLRKLLTRFDKHNIPNDSYVARMDAIVENPIQNDVLEIQHRFDVQVTVVAKGDETQCGTTT